MTLTSGLVTEYHNKIENLHLRRVILYHPPTKLHMLGNIQYILKYVNIITTSL